MAAPKGHPRYGGRKKGVLNKKTKELVDLIESSGKDPLQTMLDLLNSSEEGIRLAAAKELLQYIYPKRKAVEVSGPDGEPIKSQLSDQEKADISAEVRAQKKSDRE